jgi:hypothetical protein
MHIICERDVGLFSLIQQVVANIPWAMAEHRIPVVHFGDKTCYWTPNGYHGKDSVWEYYFEPVMPPYSASCIPHHIRSFISQVPPSPYEVGYFVDGRATAQSTTAVTRTFVSCHFGDHPDLDGAALLIPYGWDDPGNQLRRAAKVILDGFVKPRPYILGKAVEFYAAQMAGHDVIGVNARGTDAIAQNEPRYNRHGSLVLSRYVEEIERLLEVRPDAKIFMATDDQASLNSLKDTFGSRLIAYDSIRHQEGEAVGRGPTGWGVPGYIAVDRDLAARNGEEAIIEYLLLSRCDHLVHNGSSLARTVLLNAPQLPHTNTHRRELPSDVQGPAGKRRRGRR